MKSATEIQMDFKQAIKRAEELEEIAGGMDGLANKNLEETLQELSLAWKGEAGDLYLQKASALKEKILKSAKDLKSTASTIRNIARRVYDAEMRAYRLAMERKYKR